MQNQGPKSEPSNSSGESAAADSSSAGEQYLNDKDTSSSTESHKSSSKHECSSAAKQPLGHAHDDARAVTAGRVWSISEDELLRGIKNANDGLSWEEIGKILNVSKGDAKARWKTIRNALADDGGQQSSEAAPASAIATSDKSIAETNDCNEKEGKRTKPNTEETGKGSEKDSASDSFSSLSLPGDTGTKESRRQKRYWRKHIHSHLYPALIEPEPDAHFTKSDCEVLASIDSQYKASRWLEMQANFYNVTGRMVPLQVIRNKCEDAEQCSMDTADARNVTSRRRKSIEEWVGNIISHLKTGLEALPK